MRNTLTTLLVTAALLAACTPTNPSSTEGTGTDTEGSSGSGTTKDTSSTDDTPTSSSPTTPMTTDVTTSGTTAEVTSTEATDTEPVTTGMTGTTTTDMTMATTAEDSSTGTLHGMCGWNPNANYYACPADGGVPGMVDADHAIDCPADVNEGDPCTQDSEVNNYGCCTPEGVLYYCEITEMHQIIKIDCGM